MAAATDAPAGQGRCLVIAEVAQAHDGSLGFAHAFIDAAATAGADAIKFQTHMAAAESTPAEPWRVRFSRQDESRYAYWQRMEFTEEQWRGLQRHAKERGLRFLSSAFSVEAVELLSRVGVDAWKVASGEVTNTQLLDAMLRTRIEVYLSSGMSSLTELDAAVDRVRRAGVPVVVMQCTTNYPVPPERVGLNLIPLFAERYGAPVGLSDHSGTIYPGLAAAMLGIAVLEVHLTLSREMFGPDVQSSVTSTELRQLVEGVRFIEAMRRSPVDKDALAAELAPLRAMFGRSIVTRRALPAGAELREDLVTFKKPGTGLPPASLSAIVGRRLRHPLDADSVIQLDDLEPE
jgi:N-acetylneuraminate synthase